MSRVLDFCTFDVSWAGLTLPSTLSRVLDPFRSCFTTPTFETFTALVAGLVAQPAGRTVAGC